MLLKEAHNVVAAVGSVVARAATPLAQKTGRDLAWYRRERAIVEHLVDAGAPVVAPADVLDPGPHERDGYIVLFWERVDVDSDVIWDAGAVAESLVAVQRALSAYAGERPPFWPLAQFDRMSGLVDLGADQPLVVAARDRLEAVLAERQPHVRLVHGDAHLGNCLPTRSGPRWIDFEDACDAPFEWDAACIGLAAEVGAAGPVARAVFERVYTTLDEPLFDAMLDFRAAVVAQWSAWAHGSRERAEPRLEWLRQRAR